MKERTTIGGVTVYPLDAKTRAGVAALSAEAEWLYEEAKALDMEARALEAIATKYAVVWQPLRILRRWKPVALCMKKEKKLKKRAWRTRASAADCRNLASMSRTPPLQSQESDSEARRRAALFRKNAAHSRKRASVWGSGLAKRKALAAAWKKIAAAQEAAAEAWEEFAAAETLQGILPAHYGRYVSD